MTTKFNKTKEKAVVIKDESTGYEKRVSLKTFTLPNGLVETFFVDADKSSVQIFAITKEREVLLVKQFRPGNEKENFELPGGGLEENEDPMEAAARELLEETGYEAEKLSSITSLPYSPYSSGVRHSFLALDCSKTAELDLDPNEFLSVHKLPLIRFRELLKTGKIRGFDIAYIALDKLGMLDCG